MIIYVLSTKTMTIKSIQNCECEAHNTLFLPLGQTLKIARFNTRESGFHIPKYRLVESIKIKYINFYFYFIFKVG